MLTKHWYLTALAFLLIIVLAGCAPKATPSPAMPTPTSAPAPTAAAPSPRPAPALIPEEAAWQKVVVAAGKEPKLTMYSYYMVGDIALATKQGFKQSTGLDVEFVTGVTSSLIERVKAERRMGSPVASIMDGSVVSLRQAKEEGLTEVATPLPELQNKDVWRFEPVIDKERHIVAAILNLYSPWVNAKLVKLEEVPKSYKELLDPKWKGKISVPAPFTTASIVRAYYQLVTKNRILDDDYFRQLGKMVLMAPHLRMDAENVAKGDASIAFTSGVSPMWPFLEAGVPVKPIDMEEGVIGFLSGGAIVLQGVPSPNAGRVFINWLFSKEGQHIYHKAAGTESLRKDVPSFVPAAAQLTPKKVLMATTEDEAETTKLQRDRVVDKLLGR